LLAKYVSVHIYVDSHIFGVYITLCSKLYCSEVISIYIGHFERWPLLSMKRDSYYILVVKEMLLSRDRRQPMTGVITVK